MRFREGLTALVPRPNVADRFVSTPVGLFTVGDSVRCVIQRVDLARERVIATFKSAVVGTSSGSSCFLKALLRENSLAAQLEASSEGKNLPDWKKFPLASIVTGTVSSVESYGVVLTASDQTTMMLARGIHAKSKTAVTVGQVVKVLVLDLDCKNRVLDVTLDEELIAKMSPPPEKKIKKTATSTAVLASLSVKGSVVKGRVELIQAEGKYLVVSLSQSTIAYVMLTDYHCPSPGEASDFAEHQEISLRVESASVSGQGESPYCSSAILSLLKGAQRDQTARIQQDAETSDATLREKKEGKKDPAVLKQSFLDSVRLGAVLTWRVVSVSPLEVLVKPDYFESMDLKLKAAIHLTGTADQAMASDDLKKVLSKAPVRSKDATEILPGHPFFGIVTGSKLLARIVQLRRGTAAKEGSKKTEDDDKLILYLSVDGLNKAEEDSSSGKRKRGDAQDAQSNRWAPMLQLWGKNSLVVYGTYAGCVTKMEETGCIVSLSPYISSRLNFMDVSKDEAVVKLFMQRASVGLRVVVQVNSFTYEAKDSTKSKPKGITVGRARIEDFIGAGGSLKDACAKAIAAADSSSADVKLGSLVYGLLDLRSHHQHHRVIRPPALQVALGNGQTGRVCLTELTDPSEWRDCAHLMAAPSSSSRAEQLPNGRRHGELVQCRVISVPSSSSGGEEVIELSLRPSRLACKSKKDSFLPDPIPLEGSVVQAFVANCSSKGKGCFLRLTMGITGQVLMKDLSDEFVKEPHLLLPMGKLVTARVLSASQTENTAKLSLKGSVVLGDKKAEEDIKSIKVRSTVEGTVQRVTPIGVFIAIVGTSLVGLSRRSAACEDSEELSEMYEVGAFVRAKVLSVAKNSKKVALGLKPSFFVKEDIHGKDTSDNESDEEEEGEGSEEEDDDEEEDDEEEEDDDEDDEDDDNIAMLDEEDDGSDAEMDAMIRAASVQPIDSDDEEEEEEEMPKKKGKKSKAEVIEEEDSDDEDDAGPSIFAAPRTQKAKGAGMVWGDFKPKETAATIAVSKDEEEEEEEDSEEEIGGKGRTRQKEALRRKEEQAIRAREASLQGGTLVPGRPEDFERLLLAEPSSSLLWVKYMSHYLLQADLDATRQIAERALRTIGFKEEEEKLNVWLAYTNMEYKYGDMASLEGVFKRAVQESNGKLLHLNLAEAYEAAKDRKGAAAIFDKALKKYKTSKKVWMAYQHFTLRTGDSEGAKALLSRSMQSLSRHKHVEVIIK